MVELPAMPSSDFYHDLSDRLGIGNDYQPVHLLPTIILART